MKAKSLDGRGDVWGPFAFGLLLALTTLLQGYFTFFHIRDFEILAYVDNDIIYQVERFLLNLHLPGIALMNSGNADYGSELFLLMPLFRAVNSFIPGDNPLLAYYFLSAVHIVFGLGALVILRKLMLLQGMSELACLVLLLLLVSSPLFTQYLGFLKPDPNVVLFSVVLATLCLHRFHVSSRSRLFFFALGLAGFAAAIKWWGIFLIFPLTYAMYKAGNRRLMVAVSIGSVLLSLYAIQRVARKNAEFSQAFLSLLKSNISFTATHHPVFSLGVLLLSSGLLGAMIVGSVRSASPPLLRNSVAALWSLMVCSSGLISVFLIVDLPFLLSRLATESVFFYSRYVIISSENSVGSGYEPGGPLVNFWKWVQDSYISGFISPIYVVLFGAWLVLVRRKGLPTSTFIGTSIYLFFVPILLFLFFLVTKKGWAQQAMLVPLLLFILFMWGYSTWQALDEVRLVGGLLLGLCILQIAWQNNLLRLNSDDYYSQYSVYSLYRSRDHLPEMIADLNRKLENYVGHPIAPVLFCNRDFPLAQPVFKAKRLATCDDAHAVVTQMVPGQNLVLFDNQNLVFPELVKNRQLQLRETFFGKRVHRDGLIQDAPVFIYSRE